MKSDLRRTKKRLDWGYITKFIADRSRYIFLYCKKKISAAEKTFNLVRIPSFPPLLPLSFSSLLPSSPSSPPFLFPSPSPFSRPHISLSSLAVPSSSFPLPLLFLISSSLFPRSPSTSLYPSPLPSFPSPSFDKIYYVLPLTLPSFHSHVGNWSRVGQRWKNWRSWRRNTRMRS